MKKMISLLLLTAIMQQAIAQTETFDIASFKPPKEWKKDANPGAVVYSTANATTGSFCILAMYESVASLGDEQKDFKTEWNDRVVIPHSADADPKTETQTSEGWKVVTAAAPIKLEAADAYAILTVISGFGKRFTVLTMLNDQSYIAGVDDLLKNMKLNKKGKVNLSQPNNNAVTNNAGGSNEQFGTITYTTPKNWKVVKYPDGDILTPADPVVGEFLEIWVQPALNFSGSIEDALKKCYDETVSKMKATTMNDVNGGYYKKQDAKVSFRGWEYIRCTGGIHLGSGDYPPEYGLDMFVVKVNGRYEKIAIVNSRNNCSYSRYYPSDRRSYKNDIENFLFSLQFSDLKQSDPRPGIAKGDAITGDWQGISMSVGTPRPGAQLGAELKGKHLIFFSNGQALFANDIPYEGLDELNTWVRAENNRRDWGTYTFSNGRGMLKLPYADIPLGMNAGKLVITTNKTDHSFIKTNSVDGARFNGTYAMSSKNILGTETGITPLISFTSDGRFTDNGALKILYHSSVECVNEAAAPGSGTYEVKNYSIIFNYNDGRKIKLAFLGEDYDKSNQSPSTLTLSYYGNVLQKQ